MSERMIEANWRTWLSRVRKPARVYAAPEDWADIDDCDGSPEPEPKYDERDTARDMERDFCDYMAEKGYW